MPQARYIPVVIPAGVAESATFFLVGGEIILGLLTPAAWTASDLAVQISSDGGTTFFDIFDNAGSANANCVAKVVTAANEFHALALVSAGAGPLQFIPAGPQAFRLRAQTAGALTALAGGQVAARTVQVLVTKY
jgi:hypothetical protein